MKLLNRLLWSAGLLLVFSWPVLADGVNYQTIADAAQKTHDLSRQALVMIFGDVVLHPFTPGQQTVIGSLFAIINGVLCAIALFWFLTITLKTVVKAGHEGRVFMVRKLNRPLLGFLTMNRVKEEPHMVRPVAE